MRIKTLAAAAAMVIMVMSMTLGVTVPASAQQGCGLKPLKPLPPLGCKDLVARCVITVDDDGRTKGTWVWDCVPH